MGTRTNLLKFLLIHGIIGWIIIILALSNPIPQEPEELPIETWSYYQGKPPHEVMLFKYRNEILALLFLCMIIPDIFHLISVRSNQH
jgi:hypothetical protein